MIDERSKRLWERVCATVNRLGQPRSSVVMPIQVIDPPRKLDLHGIRVHDAYAVVKEFIETTPHRDITIVTGRSGQIAREILLWLEQCPRYQSAVPLNGGGAYAVRIRPPSKRYRITQDDTPSR
jgi:hypothetical protein